MNTAWNDWPADLDAEIDAYEGDVLRFLSGEMPASILKAKRVIRGVYEQRRDGTYMVRARVTAGVLTKEQAERLAELGRAYGNGSVHLTTRQNVQLHDTAIRDTPEIMRRLLEVGLTTKGGGGNTVRTVTTCPYGGVCPRECFDTTEFAQAVTDYLIRLAGSYDLPRKYKISFSGCRADCGLAQVSDLGFVAELRNGQPGFRVFAGGGMGAYSRIATLLLEWIPAREAIRIAECVRELFNRHGERRNRQRARLRFVVRRTGEEEFQRLFREEMVRTIERGVPQLNETAHPNLRREFRRPMYEAANGIRYLRQRQEGWVSVSLRPRLGLISSEDFAGLAQLAWRFSAEGSLRTTRGQGLQMRFVKESDLPVLAAALRGLNPEFVDSEDRHFTSCAGAATCRLGLCRSRDAALACERKVRRTGLAGEALKGFSVHVNGCPNACGHHPIAPIGLSGVLQKVHGSPVPYYRVTMGGRCDSRGARFGFPMGQVPAEALPDLLSEFACDFARQRANDEAFSEYFERMGREHFVGILNRYAGAPLFEDDPQDTSRQALEPGDDRVCRIGGQIEEDVAASLPGNPDNYEYRMQNAEFRMSKWKDFMILHSISLFAGRAIFKVALLCKGDAGSYRKFRQLPPPE